MLASLCLWLTSFALQPSANEELLQDPDAARLFRQAQVAFESKDYATAREKLEQAYLIEPKPQLLYAWGQAERGLGNCSAAEDLYEKFLDSNPAEHLAAAARQNIERCTARSPAPGEVDEPSVDHSEPAKSGAPAEPAQAPVPPARSDAGPPSRPPGKDVLAGVFVGVGAAATITGVGLLSGAIVQAKRIGNGGSNTEYVEKREQALGLHVGGIAVASIGGALVIAGAIRYIVLAKRAPRQNGNRLGASVTPGGGTLVWTGRF